MLKVYSLVVWPNPSRVVVHLFSDTDPTPYLEVLGPYAELRETKMFGTVHRSIHVPAEHARVSVIAGLDYPTGYLEDSLREAEAKAEKLREQLRRAEVEAGMWRSILDARIENNDAPQGR